MPKGYLLAQVEVTDPALFETYRPLAAAAVAAFGGRYLVRGGNPKAMEGGEPSIRTVILEFESPEKAMAWYNSPEYEAAKQIRHKSAKTNAVLLTEYTEG